MGSATFAAEFKPPGTRRQREGCPMTAIAIIFGVLVIACIVTRFITRNMPAVDDEECPPASVWG